MTIEINKPELEALMKQQLDSGAYRDVDELLTEALDALRAQNTASFISKKPKQNLAQFLLASPLPGSGLQIETRKDHPRAIEL